MADVIFCVVTVASFLIGAFYAVFCGKL